MEQPKSINEDDNTLSVSHIMKERTGHSKRGFLDEKEVFLPVTAMDNIKVQDKGFLFLPQYQLIKSTIKFLHLICVAHDRHVYPQMMFLFDGIEAGQNMSSTRHQLSERSVDDSDELFYECQEGEGPADFKKGKCKS